MGYIDLGDGESTRTFDDSSKAEWDPTKTLTIQNWNAEKDTVRFGNSAAGLNASQLKPIRFESPSGLPMGWYSAKLLKDGRLIPDPSSKKHFPPAVAERPKTKR